MMFLQRKEEGDRRQGARDRGQQHTHCFGGRCQIHEVRWCLVWGVRRKGLY